MAKNKLRMLIVDDDDVNNFILTKLIKEARINVSCTTASNGRKALNRLRKLHEKGKNNFPDIILLDLHMPIMDGFEFLDNYEQELFASHPNLHLYMLSASIRVEDRAKAKSYRSVSNFISKPLSIAAIKQIVAQCNLTKSGTRI